jgi:hypothetical protein
MGGKIYRFSLAPVLLFESGARKLNPNTTRQGRTGWEKSSEPIKGAALDRMQM